LLLVQAGNFANIPILSTLNSNSIFCSTTAVNLVRIQNGRRFLHYFFKLYLMRKHTFEIVIKCSAIFSLFQFKRELAAAILNFKNC
jgi:hypothetical protein